MNLDAAKRSNFEMGMSFYTRQLMSVGQAVDLLKWWGCKVDESSKNTEYEVTIVDPDGNYLILSEGTGRVSGYCNFGQDPDFMVRVLNMSGEDDDDFEEIADQVYVIPVHNDPK